MNLNKQVVNILSSPCCLSNLKEKKNEVVCLKCNRVYKIEEGRPVLVKRARIGFNKKLLKYGRNQTYRIEKLPLVKMLFSPSESLRIVDKDKLLIAKLSIESLALYIGENRTKNDHKQVVYIDIDPELDVDVIADVNDLPFKNKSFSLVICNFVLEHLPDPKRVVEEIYRVLKKDGLVYINMPFLAPFHPAPYDYNRLTLGGLRVLMSDFKEIESGISQGPASALAWVLRKFPGIFFNNQFLYRISLFIMGWLVFPLKYLDYFLVKRKYAYVLASAFYYIGRKKGRGNVKMLFKEDSRL